MIDRRLLNNFDWAMVGVVIITSIIGVVLIYSATHNQINTYVHLYMKQSQWIGLALIAMLVTISIDYKVIAKYAVNELVEHDKFGLGRVKEYVAFGEDSIVVVRFNSGKTKSLMVKYANLSRVH